jgi:hypothetical protein
VRPLSDETRCPSVRLRQRLHQGLPNPPVDHRRQPVDLVGQEQHHSRQALGVVDDKWWMLRTAVLLIFSCLLLGSRAKEPNVSAMPRQVQPE